METIKDTDMKWYMIKCVTGKEEKAIEILKSEIEFNGLDEYVADIFSPKQKQFFMRNKKKINRDKLMFPGYILINANLKGELPRVIKSTNYITQIMGNSSGPEALKDREINKILGDVEENNSEIEFIEGEVVKIIDGPFKGFEGTVQSVNKEREKVTMEVLIFGTPRPMELNFMQLERSK